MRVFASHDTALSYWRTHFPLDSELGAPARMSSAQECASNKPDILDCIPESLIVPGRPIDILVFDVASCHASTQVKYHLWGGVIPDNAFYKIGSMMVSSPEFTFLQMAQKLPLVQLIALGCELCGLYVLDQDGNTVRNTFDACPTRLAPLTNLEKLKSFLGATKRASGIQKATRALKYVVEGSRSPMETMVYLYLCLPPLLGGYGLEKPVMNATIELDDAARQIAQRGYCQGDLCWPEHKLDIEYHGEVHVGAAQMKSDVGRTLGIEHMGWRVITVTSPQVRDVDRFELIAQEAAQKLRFRLRTRVLGDLPARRTLRQQLEEWTFGK